MNVDFVIGPPEIGFLTSTVLFVGWVGIAFILHAKRSSIPVRYGFLYISAFAMALGQWVSSLRLVIGHEEFRVGGVLNGLDVLSVGMLAVYGFALWRISSGRE